MHLETKTLLGTTNRLEASAHAKRRNALAGEGWHLARKRRFFPRSPHAPVAIDSL
jgi:hypothetical protein